MSRKETRPQLPLKVGSIVDAQTAYVAWRRLESIAKQRPEYFERLVALAGGNDPSVPETNQAALKNRYPDLFDASGKISTITRAVILSMCVEGEPSSQCNPFKLATDAEVETYEKVEATIFSRLMNFLGGADRGPAR